MVENHYSGGLSMAAGASPAPEVRLSAASEASSAPAIIGEAEAQGQMFKSLADHSQEFIGMCDLNFKPFYVNEAGMKLVGLDSLAEACAARVQDFFFPEDQRFISEEFFPKVLSEGRGEVEVRFRHFKTGAALWMIYNVFQVRDAQGEVSGYATVSRDITERKRAEAAVRESEARLRLFIEHAPVSIAMFDRELRYLAVSDRWLTEYLPGRGSVIGRSHYELFPECPERWRAAHRRGLDGEVVREEEDSWRMADGRTLWARYEVRPWHAADGGIGGILIFTEDITERKAFQTELQRLVAERTARLQELVGDLEHFSYTITHDLKAPLRAMRGFAEMMSLTCGACDQVRAKEFLGRISTAAERMDHLIADALDYSRSVQEELPLQDVDPGALLRGMLASYPELQPERAQIVVEEPMPVVLANQGGLTQCFSNLLSNAVKFVPRGGKPEIRVWASQLEGWVRIWVEDRGIGISQDALPRVFDMFSRGSKDYEGTGIGLALVRKVVQRMAGRVGVESKEGSGSRFWIELRSGQGRRASAEATAAPVSVFGEATVLYAEDEEADVMFMERAFAEKGLAGRLQVARTGRAAIDYLSGSGEYGDREKYPVPGLVLLDLNLPQVPGFGVLEWIRDNPDYARMPVVVFSSSTREDDQTKARELGAAEFVVKPNSGLKFGEVVESLQRKWLGRQRGIINASGAPAAAENLEPPAAANQEAATLQQARPPGPRDQRFDRGL